MRMTFGTAAAISAIVLMTSAFWPEGRPGLSPPKLVAQSEANQATTRVPLFSPRLGDADLQAEANLRKRIDVDCIDTPFADALDELEHQSELQFYVKVRYLEDIGISTNEPVTLSLTDVSVDMALQLMLENLDLTYVIRDGIVLVTTAEDFESIAEVRVYNCRDLLEAYVGYDVDESESDSDPSLDHGTDASPAEKKNNRNGKKKKSEDKSSRVEPHRHQSSPKEVFVQFGGGGGGFVGGGGGGGGIGVAQGPMTEEEQLMNIISIAVMPESWEEMGGPGTIGEFDGMIVIRQNPRAHRQVEQVLHMLRDASGQQNWQNAESRRGFMGQGGLGSGGGGFF